MNATHHDITAVSVGALVGAGKLLSEVEPILASLSYIAAIVVALVTVFYKIKNRGK